MLPDASWATNLAVPCPSLSKYRSARIPYDGSNASSLATAGAGVGARHSTAHAPRAHREAPLFCAGEKIHGSLAVRLGLRPRNVLSRCGKYTYIYIYIYIYIEVWGL